MASLTLSVPEEWKKQLQHFSWVNWSEIARQEVVKKLIFEGYLKTGVLTDEAWAWCNKFDWHPADELPLRAEFIKKLQTIKKEKSRKVKMVGDIFQNML